MIDATPFRVALEREMAAVGAFRADVLTRARLAFAEQDATTDALLTDLQAHAGPARDAVDRLIAGYRAGTLTLAQLVSQARQATADAYTDTLDDTDEQKRSPHHVRSAVLALGAVAGLAMLHNRGSVSGVARDGVNLSLSTGAAEFGSSVTRAESKAATSDLQDRLDAIKKRLADGEISEAQAARWSQTVTHGALWSGYQTRRNGEAQAAGKATISFVLDPSVKQHCQDCLDRADGSPYPIDDAPGLPGDGSTDCQDADMCDVEYGDEAA